LLSSLPKALATYGIISPPLRGQNPADRTSIRIPRASHHQQPEDGSFSFAQK
jgi:hypothetical protein